MRLFLIPFLLIFAINLVGTHASLSTVDLEANSLVFTCTLVTSNTTTGQNVVLVHGFPMNRTWYDPLLNSWDQDDSMEINAVSCDMRGYSPGASPNSIDEYHYDILASDVFALAEAAGFEQFHLVGHDHGGALGWLVTSQTQGQVLSYTSMVIPHPDRWSAALCGDDVDPESVVASNYFNHFGLPDSATRNDGALTSLFAAFTGGTDDPEQFQKKLWWYNGSMPLYMSLPRIVNDTEVGSADFILAVRQAVPLEPRPCVPQQKSIGTIDVPVLFVCGAQDPFVLCTRPYTEPGELVPEYTYYEATTCGHDFFLEGDCSDPTESQKVITTITEFIARNDTSTAIAEPGMSPSNSGVDTSTSGAGRRVPFEAFLFLSVLMTYWV